MAPHEITKHQFQQLSEFPASSFQDIWETVTRHIRNEPEDSIGVAGPRAGREAFLSWVIKYLDGGISEQFWGQETQGKWKIADDKDEIVKFFRLLVMNRAKSERQWRKRGKIARITPLRQTMSAEEHEDKNMVCVVGDLLPSLAIAHPSSQENLHGANTQPEEGLATITTSNNNPLIYSSDSGEVYRTFNTRLGPENITTPVFAPLTISFRHFFGCFCEAWGIKKSEMISPSHIEVKVCIPRLGEYCIGLGGDREKYWRHIMKLAKNTPESGITVIF